VAAPRRRRTECRAEERLTPEETPTATGDAQFWTKVRDLFHAAESASPEERARILEAIDDAAVRAEVESLLAAHDEASDFLEPEPQRQSFNAGDLISGRYRIVKLLGVGGMGEVYEAEDRELGENVALKIIRPEIASRPRILARFRREIQLARRVTHPNVCRIYDVSYHVTADGEGPAEKKISFVSMELLHGRTLAAQLRTAGRMAIADALPIVRQMAAGLDAAHAASIIHRDFKSANVMLASSQSSADAPVRAVITDFGLAYETGSDAANRDARLTDTGMVIGTPDYMAPEQLEQGPLSPATDIYALGVVLFEMVTGRLPFDGATPMTIAMNRLRNPAPSPRALVPELTERWEAVILRCLERDPAQRFQRAGDVAAALEEGSPMPRITRATSRVSRRLLWPAIALAIVAGLLPLFLRKRNTAAPAAPQTQTTATSAPAFKPRRTIAVLGFRNLSGRSDQAWLDSAFSELLSTEISATDTLRLVPQEDVERLESDFNLRNGEIGRTTLPRIRERLGTDIVVSGSYLSLGGESANGLRLDVRLQDASTGELVGTLSESGTQADLLALVSRLGNKLRDGLGAAPLSAEETASLRASRPSNAEAARLYVEGLQKLRRWDPLAARDLLQKAIAKEPDYPMSHTALAETFWTLGNEAAAITEADKALTLASSLGREERLSIEARADVFHKQWDKAIEIYRSLLTFYPDELAYGLRLGITQIAAGKGADALATMAKLRALPAPLRNDPGIELVTADAYRTLHDPKQELEAAKRAEAIGAASSMRIVVARAKANQSYAYRDLGQNDRSVALLRESAKIYEEAGDRGGAGRSLSNLALSLWSIGNLREAESVLEKALAMHREVGSRSFESRTLNNIGMIRFSKGDMDGAEKAFREALAVQRESNFITMLGPTISNLGGVLQTRGDLDGALKMYAEAIEVARKTDDHLGSVTAYVNSAETLRLLGRVAESKEQYDRTIAVAREMHLASQEAYAQAGLGELALLRGDVAEAQRQHATALATRRKGNESIAIAQSQTMMANLALETKGDLAASEASLREAIATCAKEGAADDETAAHETLARVLLARGRVADARAEIARARTIAKDTHTITLLTAMAATEARVELASGHFDAAATKAQEAAAIAKRGQLLGAELDARLVEADADAKRGKASEARTIVAGVKQRAEAKGLGLYARKAADKNF